MRNTSGSIMKNENDQFTQIFIDQNKNNKRDVEKIRNKKTKKRMCLVYI